MKYPIYIVSKGRWENPLTASFFQADGVPHKVVVEPQEYDNYVGALGEDRVLKLPFSNLGLGSYPARNWIWEHSIKEGHKRHWIFDDNIVQFRRMHKGHRIPCSSELAINAAEEFTDRYTNVPIAGFNYTMFVVTDIQKPFFINTHVYSALLIQNDFEGRWRMKYNEDVDLNLQVLTKGLCTVLFNAFAVEKISTTAAMKGGNQSLLYANNDPKKFWIKSKALQNVWPEYVDVKQRFGRWHHVVTWKKYFKQQLIRRDDLDWDKIAKQKVSIKLVNQKETKSRKLRAFQKEYNKTK